MIRTDALHWLMALTAAVLVSGCVLLSKEGVPTAEDIEAWMGPFLVSPNEIRGVYRNLDIDCLVFTYDSAVDDEDAFWTSLEELLEGSRWTSGEQQGAIREFRRSFAKGEHDAERPDMAIFSSFEVTRIFYDSTARTAVVAYVQADGSSDDTRFEQTGEAKWAETTLWPRFQGLVEELTSTPDVTGNK